MNELAGRSLSNTRNVSVLVTPSTKLVLPTNEMTGAALTSSTVMLRLVVTVNWRLAESAAALLSVTLSGIMTVLPPCNSVGVKDSTPFVTPAPTTGETRLKVKALLVGTSESKT